MIQWLQWWIEVLEYCDLAWKIQFPDGCNNRITLRRPCCSSATELLSGLMNIYLGQYVRGLFGAVIVAALLYYLFRPALRGVFEGEAA